MSSSRLLVALSLLTVYLAWGACYVVIKFGLEGFPPFLLAGLRNLLAGGILLLAMGGLREHATRPARLRLSVVIGLLIVAGASGGGTLALGHVAAGTAAMLFALAPLWWVVMAACSGVPPKGRELWGLALGVGAMLVLFADELGSGTGSGLAALVLATLCLAGGSELARRESTPFGPDEVGLQMLAGGLVLTVSGLFLEPVPVSAPSARAWAALLFLAFFGSALAYTAYLFLLSRVRPALAASHAYVNPVVAAGLGWLLLGERITGGAALATLMTIPAVTLLSSSEEEPLPDGSA